MTDAHATRTHSEDSARQLVKALLTWAIPRRWFITRGPESSRTVALTFDDGPHPEHTPEILDFLRAEQVRATFFVVGREAARCPHLVRRMVAEGHAVGHHSYTHGSPGSTPTRALAAEVAQSVALLRDLGVESPTLFRPPHGKLTPTKLLMLWRHRCTVVLWSLDPRDGERDSPEALRAALAAKPMNSGDIVLLHDDHAGIPEALGLPLASARRDGLAFVTVDEWTR
jgi:peptidoglycan/xylan/chitin deacetylase (PgdA/CDA1 family)